MKDMGVLMKELTPVLKGKADMKLVNDLIKEKLNQKQKCFFFISKNRNLCKKLIIIDKQFI